MFVTQWSPETITNAYYRGEEQRDVLAICTERSQYSVMNGNFALDNPALQLMAYYGVRPSTLDEIVGKELLVSVDGVILDMVFQQGRRSLESSDWGPSG